MSVIMKSKMYRYHLQRNLGGAYIYKELCFVFLIIISLVYTSFGSTVEQNQLQKCWENATFGLDDPSNEWTSKNSVNLSATPFDDAFIEYEGGNIILSRLDFVEGPFPQLRAWDWNRLYEYFNAIIEWDLVDLQGSYTIYSNLSDSLCTKGELRLMWHNVTAQGRIAVQFAKNGSHYLSTNYDLNFEAQKFELLLLDNMESWRNKELFNATSMRINSELQDQLFWNLQERLHNYLDKILMKMKVGPKIALSGRVPQNYRVSARKRMTNGNAFIDLMINLGRDFLKATGNGKLRIPNIHKTFTSGILKAEVMASDGIAQDIAVFKRKTGFSYEKFRYHEFYGYLTFTDLWAQYKRLTVKFLFSVGLGSITARVGANKVFVKLTLDDDRSKLFGYRLVEYYIKVHVKHVKVRVYNNLPVVDWILSQIVNYVSNLYVKQISLMIEKNLKDAIKKVFRKKL